MDTITPEPRPAWIAGRAEQGAGTRVVTHPYDGSEVATVAVPAADQVERAVAAAAEIAPALRRSPAHARAEALEQVSRGLTARAEELAEVITAESGKPLRWAEAEVTRAVSVFRLAAERTRHSAGEMQRAGTEPAGAGRVALVRRVPRGAVLAVTPFDSPLGLVADRVAPALAVGAPVVVTPAPRTPLSALVLGELLADTDLPAGAFSVLPVGDAETTALAAEPRLPVVSFTGSATAGRSLAEAADRKHLVLELGGNTTVAVLADWPDLDDAARRIATFGTCQAGQSRTAVQRVVVQRAVAEEFVSKLTDAVRAQRTGDPYDAEVSVGPVVDEAAAERIVAWIDEATAGGAKVLTGGSRETSTVQPTLLTDVPADAKVWTEEVFGPVLAVSVVDSADDAFAAVNVSAHGSQAGVFTRDVRAAFRAADELDIGGLVVGDVPSSADGVEATMRDLTEERVLVLAGLDR
ncbi:aldehyde dehydrogenase family protein [Qaidamihabitans albus]|uniref:aldehyde dehydrogenase family protein n=1 Tax=Qaidamihabitans albus TaxID=2795733 RepID=UPI0018F1C845|nr:aldehyde dehydrogenase family protein [Qaidamihabitans albus]